MKVQDDRTFAQRSSHCNLVVAVDTFLSGWGKAEGGRSFAIWACQPEHTEQVERWVRGRGDTRNVKIRDKGYLLSGDNKSHCHVYVVDENHRALKE